MAPTLTRRQALLGVSSSLLLPAGCATNDQPLANEVFAHGVASGDPDATSVVLWTRVSGANGPIEVRWTLSETRDLGRIVGQGRVTTDADRDFTVKVIPGNLVPGRTYYFLFEAAGARSPIGRTLTLPDAGLDELTLAVASCSNYPFGFFNGYEAIADDPDVDVVVHLGDYIYEYDEDGYGAAAGKRLGRIHSPTHEIVSLADYRMRHAQYKADPGSLAMHAQHPLIHTWDDHESTNNPWRGGAQNHQPEEGDWLQRRADSFRAYYEWMPVRDPEGLPQNLWRHYKFGDLASLITLESRHTARSEQIELSQYSERMTDPASASVVYNEVVGAEDRQMISAEQEVFVGEALKESIAAGRPWRLIGNQTIMAEVIAADLRNDPVFERIPPELSESAAGLLDMLTNLGALGIAGNMDAWDGYPAARERLYRIAREAGASDLLVITGDTHVFWANELTSRAGFAMGVELGTSAITSPRGFYQLGAEATERYDQLLAAQNQSVEWVDGRYRGFIKLTLTPERARAEYIAISDIESQNYSLDTLRVANIVHDDGSLRYA